MFGITRVINVFNSFFSKDNIDALENWSTKNKKIIIPATVFIGTLSISEAFFKLSHEYSLFFSAASFGATIIDQKYPKAKYEILNKISELSTMIYDRYQEVEKEKNESLIKREKKEALKNVRLMESFLEFSNIQISKVSKEETSPFIICCRKLGLSTENIQTLLNYYETSPNSVTDSIDDYNTRYEKFIGLLSDNNKSLFQKIEKKD